MPIQHITIEVDLKTAPIVTRAQEAIAELEAAVRQFADVVHLLGFDVHVAVHVTERPR